MTCNNQGVVPILSKKGRVTGIWVRDPQFTLDLASLAAEIGLQAEPMLMTMSVPVSRVPNGHLTVLHNSQLPGGVFLMRNNELAPNEAMERHLTEYGLLDIGDGILFLHATREFTETAERSAGRPERPDPASAVQCQVGPAALTEPPRHWDMKRWLRFWR